MKYRNITLAGFAAATIALAACNGGGHALPAMTNGSSNPRAASVKATFSVHIPARGTTTSSLRRPAYISPSTNGIAIASFTSPYYAGAVPTASGAFDVSSNSPSCSPAIAGGGSMCTFEIAVPAGTDDFIVTTYDAAPVNNMMPAGAHRLGYGMVTNETIKAGAANTIDIALGGVVSKFTLSMSQASSANWSCDNSTTCHLLHGSNFVTQNVTVNAWDSSNNLIIASDGWYDNNGNPVTVTLSNDANPSPQPNVTPTPAFGFNTPEPATSPSASPAPTGPPQASVTVTAATSSQIALTYDPTKMVYTQMVGGFGNAGNGNASTLTAQPSSTGITAGTATVSLTPVIFENGIPAGPSGAGASLQYLTQSPVSSKLWMGDNQGIFNYDPTTFTFSPVYATKTTAGGVKGIVPVSDTSLWFVEPGGNTTTNPGLAGTLQITGTPATPTVYETPMPTYNYSPSAVARDSGGNMWYLQGVFAVTKLGRVMPAAGSAPLPGAAPITEYTPLASIYAGAIGADMTEALDGNSLWLIEKQVQTPTQNVSYLDQIDTTSTAGTNAPTATTGTILLRKALPAPVAPFTTNGGSAVTMDRYNTSPANGGPGYGTVWVGCSGMAHFAAYNPVTSTWTDYPQKLSGTLVQIAVAPDHTVWGTENSGGKLAHLVPGPNGSFTQIEYTVGTAGLFGVVPTANGIWFVNSAKNLLVDFVP